MNRKIRTVALSLSLSALAFGLAACSDSQKPAGDTAPASGNDATVSTPQAAFTSTPEEDGVKLAELYMARREAADRYNRTGPEYDEIKKEHNEFAELVKQKYKEGSDDFERANNAYNARKAELLRAARQQ